MLTVNVIETRVAHDMHAYHCVCIALQEDAQCVVFDITIMSVLMRSDVDAAAGEERASPRGGVDVYSPRNVINASNFSHY